MEYLKFLIDSVPDVIWSGIIASLLTFIGVLWTNKGAEKRQILLLKFEKEKFQSQQKLALKKEVFIGVSSHFSICLNGVVKLANLDFSHKHIEEELTSKSYFVANSYLVAKDDSLEKILEFSTEIAEVFPKLIPERIVLLDYKEAVSIYKNGIDNANKEKNRIVSIMKEFNLQGRNDKAVFDYLERDYKFQDSIIIENTEAIKKTQDELDKMHIEFCKKCFEEHSRLISLLPSVAIALRNELETETDSQKIMISLNKNVERVKVVYSKIFNNADD